MALDLGRLLRHEPVTAAPPSVGYRTIKFVRRHRAATLAGAAVTLALFGGGVAATVGFVQAARARDAALVEAQKAAVVSGFLTNMFASVEPDRARGNVVTVLGVLDSAAARLDRDRPFADQTDVEATIRFSIGNSYRELGEYGAAIPMLARALEIWQATLDPDDERIAEALHGLGNSHWRRGDLEESLEYAAQVLALRARTVGRMHLKYSEAVHVLGNSHADLGHFAVAESLYREAVWIDSMVLEGPQRERLATSLNNLATVLVDQERPDEAVQVFEQAMAIRREYLHPDDPQIGTTLANLGHAILLAGRVPHAVDTLELGAAFLERVYGPEHVHTASAWRRLGEAYLRTGETSYRVGQVLLRRGEVRATAGEPAAGLAEMERGWQLIHDGLQAGHPITRAAAITIADRLAAQGDVGRAAIWRARGES
jgi:tetratricopeptide (TPR) repeat protein